MWGLNKINKIGILLLGLLLILPMVSSAWTSNLNDELLHYWTMNDGNGTNVMDSMQRANGTMTDGDPYNVTGKVGDALYFTKENSNGITFSNDYIKNLDRDFSVSFWVNKSSTDDYGNFITNGDYGSGAWGINMRVGATNQLQLTRPGVEELGLGIVNAVLDDQWGHVVITVNASGWGSLYVNGVENDTAQINSPMTTASTNGMMGDDSTSVGITGIIDEMGIWNRTLNASEVEQLYNSGNGITYEPPAPPSAPVINIVYPTAIEYNVNVTTIDYTVSDADNCWYSIDNGATNSTITCGNNVTGITPSEGEHTWTVYANNSIGESSDSVSFSVDTISPQISIEFPVNAQTYTQNISHINFTVNNSHLESCWYSLDNGATNSTTINCNVTGSYSFTGLTSVLGSNSWTVYVNDTYNNQNSETVTFTKSQITCTVLNSNNYTISGNRIIASAGNPFIGNNVNVTYDYSYENSGTVGEIADDTSNSLAETINFVPIIIVITVMIVLILLTVLIIKALKNNGMVSTA